MRIPIVIILTVLAVTGCSKKEEYAAMAPAAEASSESEDSQNRYMAYEHSIRLDVEESKVAAVQEAAQAACRKAIEEKCVILESSLDTGRHHSASLKLRAKPPGIKKITAALITQGDVIYQSTTAEDLAKPIGDSSKKLDMLNDYRAKLEALRGRASSDIDALIKVNKELATVQSEIEAMSGERAYLFQRVETEILNVSITSFQNRSFWSPVSNAMSNFGSNLSEGVSSAITGIAFLIPWGITFIFLFWAGRKLWRVWRRPQKNA